MRKLLYFVFTLILVLISLFALTGVAYAFSPDTSLSNADASFWGEDIQDFSGGSVAGAGDVNNDGFDDFLIGAFGDDDGGNDAGQTYLILGSGWSMDTSLANANASFIGEDADDGSGFSVAGVGDVNDDGFDDFLIGAYGDDDGGANAGQTYLILGKDSGWSMDFDLSNANASFLGEDAGDTSGHSVAGAGDVNNDGFDDFLIGAFGDDDGGTSAGQTYLILGKDSGWSMDFDLSNADASFWGEDAGDNSGHSVAGAGDVNNDGFDDFLIGAYEDEDGGADAGQTYLILGKASGWSIDTSLSNANASFIGEGAGDWSGCSEAGAGDVNNDGFDDFLIGASHDGEGGTSAGQTYLILGKASGWSMDTSLASADASFIGESTYDYSGTSEAGAGDVNNDGFDDFLISASENNEGGSKAGQTYLILGKISGWTMDFDLSNADASFWGEHLSDHSGSSVAGAGDVNDDGFNDFLIGAYVDDDGGADAGQTYLLLGEPTPGITASAISGNTTEEGGTATFTIVLDSQPNADVVIPLTSDDPSEGAVSPASLTFTSANWNIPQTITVTGRNDHIHDGDIVFNVIIAAASSTDPGYNGLDATDVPVINTDDDIVQGVGGEVYPVDKTGLLAPWIILAVFITAEVIYLARRKKHNLN